MIRPTILAAGLAQGQKQAISFEFYHPTVCSRQFGLGQLPISLYYVGQVKPLSTVDRIEWNFVNSIGEEIPLGRVVRLRLSPFYSDLARAWWEEW